MRSTSSSVSREATAPVGLLGYPIRMALVRGVTAASRALRLGWKLSCTRLGISTGIPPASTTSVW
ncbi:MAG: hypothetical protein A2W35_03085 [Chloroflexi bacterium RBG_16_57_11]|nr:MAG: hypothetical protein A2W35_03085 [Chloroflexi bacterium RBG_16_57_11]